MDYAQTLVEKICKERKLFREFYFCENTAKVYTDYYRIFFFEQYRAMLTNDYVLKHFIKKEVTKWLSEKDSPITFLYTEWLNTDGYLSDNWDDMTEFIGLLYTKCMESEG